MKESLVANTSSSKLLLALLSFSLSPTFLARCSSRFSILRSAFDAMVRTGLSRLMRGIRTFPSTLLGKAGKCVDAGERSYRQALTSMYCTAERLFGLDCVRCVTSVIAMISHSVFTVLGRCLNSVTQGQRDKYYWQRCQ
ncbi:hypothetical protein BDV97DRAFT_360263 [Delphinella strobiligena]|nr:hypothetical protein BDV97DRAFT_360263 [Delphinella strobiligena]